MKIIIMVMIILMFVTVCVWKYTIIKKHISMNIIII